MPKKINPVRAQIIGDKLDKLISESGVSKSEVARAVGVDPSQITRIIDGSRYPSHELLIDLADYFNVSTDYIYGRT